MTENLYYHNDVFGSKLLVGVVKQWLGDRVLEVGSGIGHVTSELAIHCKQVISLEPDPLLFRELRTRTEPLRNVRSHQQTLNDFILSRNSANQDLAESAFDAVVYINVLEHIEDDVLELARARKLLAPGGNIVIIVPAHKWLYAKIDFLSGHHRRYSKKLLLSRIEAAGLETVSIKYFDFIGIAPYLLLYRLLRRTSVGGTNARLYSKVVLPLSYALFRASGGNLLGKNLVASASALKEQRSHDLCPPHNVSCRSE